MTILFCSDISTQSYHSMASSLPGPPDLISDMVQPVDLVNSVQNPAVATLEQNHSLPADIVVGNINRMPVDMLGDLPSPGTAPAEDSSSPDITTDRLDARWFSKGSGSNGLPSGAPMPTAKDAEFYNMNHRRRGKAFVFNHMNFDPRLQLRPRNGTNCDRDNLRINLRQLDFEVEVYDDLPLKEIERILESAVDPPYGALAKIGLTLVARGFLENIIFDCIFFLKLNSWSHQS